MIHSILDECHHVYVVLIQEFTYRWDKWMTLDIYDSMLKVES